MKNAINWFEIPVTDFDRAKKFYETILGSELHVMEAMGMKSGFFPADMMNGGVGGSITTSEGYQPAKNGTLIYLNGGDDLALPLSKVHTAGGSILLPKTAIGQNAFMAQFMDSEGNKIGLHSMK